jgi:folate-binding protein YgfZ
MSVAIDHPERTTLDDAQGQIALRQGAGVVDVARDVVRVTGADATTFLQGQISQDVERLLPGSSAWSFVLQPQGKVDAWFRVSRLDDTEFVLDVDAGAGDLLVARLERFKLRVDCTFERLDWSCVALRGPEVEDLGPYEATVAAEPGWPGVDGVDLLGPEVLVPAGIPSCPSSALEALRIEAGVPRMGSELGEDTIPASAGVVERSVSFSKGCYTGQELVARIDSRGGNVPTRLVGVVMPGLGAAPPVGTSVLVDHDEAATLTSVARSQAVGAYVGLAYLPRKVEVPSPAQVDWGDGHAEAELRALPLV